MIGACATAAGSMLACDGDGDLAPDGGDDDTPIVDASRPDATRPGDSGLDATLPGPDGSDPDGSADADAGALCSLTGYPIPYRPSASESAAIEGAITAFESANQGVTVTLDEVTHAVAAIDGEPPIALDANVADPCQRAVAGLQKFIADNLAMIRTPEGMTLKTCAYDDLTDSEIIRLQGGTYFGRPMLSSATEILAHVKRDGHLRYWASTYEPVLERPAAVPCLSADQAAASVVGDSLEYTKFASCRPDGTGSIGIVAADTRRPLEQGVFVDEQGSLHFVRVVETLLDADRVTSEEGNSDLYCCAEATLEGCVGKLLIVDELDGAILRQVPRCHTC